MKKVVIVIIVNIEIDYSIDLPIPTPNKIDIENTISNSFNAMSLNKKYSNYINF